MARVVVVGAGVMGLAAAYHAVKAGHDVELLEAGADPGGMAAHFDFDGLSIERFYHFLCTNDQPTFELLREIGLPDIVEWRRTTMGLFANGRLNAWGDPIALLRFSGVSLLSRLRYGLLAFVSTRRDRWDALENQTAREWIVRWTGQEVYDKLWKPLFDLKFYELAENISARWIWARINRLGRSRKSIFEERLGYISGGSQSLVDRLVELIEEGGGRVFLSTPVSQIISEGGKVTGVEAADGFHAADAVISTMPTPLISKAVPDLPDDWKARYDSIENIGVCCLVFKLKRQVTPHFWVNVCEPGMPVPGIIEFSNLRPIPDGSGIVYVPYYMPVTNPKFAWSDEQLLAEAFACIQRINPSVSQEDILAQKVSRLRYSQPVCEPGFASRIPPVQTPIAGLQVADTCYYYPEDRGIAESVKLGKEMARNVELSIAGGQG